MKTATPDSQKARASQNRATTKALKRFGPHEIEEAAAVRMIETGAAKVTERGNENTYLTDTDGKLLFFKHTGQQPQTFLERAIDMAKKASIGNSGEVHIIQIGPDHFAICETNCGKHAYVASYREGKLTNEAWNLSDVARNA